MKHEVERAILQFSLITQRILKQLEVRDAVAVERHQFAIDHGVTLDQFERFCKVAIAMAYDFAVTAIEGNLSAFDIRNHAEPVVLILKDPAHVIERGIRERRKHRLQAFRQCRRPAHCIAPSMRTLHKRSTIEGWTPGM